MTCNELFELASQYSESGDAQKAIEYYTLAANAGSVNAMYNLGVIYSTADGVKMDKPTAKKWYQQAADHGDKDAQELIDSMETADALTRVARAGKSLDAYQAFRTIDNLVSISLFKEAIEYSEKLWTPNEEDLFDRREDYRYLGMITYLNNKDNNEADLLLAKEYYEKGLPVIETKDLRTAAFYAALMNRLSMTTGEKSYSIKCYQTCCQIYEERFNEIDDNDIKLIVLQGIFSEKVSGEIYPKDLDGAQRLNEEIGSFGPDYAREYQRNCQFIDKARESSPAQNITVTSSVPPKSFFKRLFGLD